MRQPLDDKCCVNLSMEVDAATPGGAGVAPAWFPPPQPIVPAAEAEECTYEGVSRETDGTSAADGTVRDLLIGNY